MFDHIKHTYDAVQKYLIQKYHTYDSPLNDLDPPTEGERIDAEFYTQLAELGIDNAHIDPDIPNGKLVV